MAPLSAVPLGDLLCGFSGRQVTLSLVLWVTELVRLYRDLTHLKRHDEKLQGFTAQSDANRNAPNPEKWRM